MSTNDTPARVRVWALARQLNTSTAELLPLIAEVGVPATSATSTMSMADAATVSAAWRQSNGGANPPSTTAKAAAKPKPAKAKPAQPAKAAAKAKPAQPAKAAAKAKPAKAAGKPKSASKSQTAKNAKRKAKAGQSALQAQQDKLFAQAEAAAKTMQTKPSELSKKARQRAERETDKARAKASAQAQKAQERAEHALEQARLAREALAPIPCTHCEYCLPCPSGVAIPWRCGVKPPMPTSKINATGMLREKLKAISMRGKTKSPTVRNLPLPFMLLNEARVKALISAPTPVALRSRP